LIWTEIGLRQMQHQEGKDQNAVVIKRRRRNERRSENEKNVGNDRDRDRPIRRPTGLLHEERNRGDDGDVPAHTLEKIERVPLENPVLLENELRSTRDERDDHTHAALPEQHLGVYAGSRLAGGAQAEWGVGPVGPSPSARLCSASPTPSGQLSILEKPDAASRRGKGG